MPAKREVALRFKDKATFGRFCMTLNEEEIPFRLAGAQIVVMAESDHRRLEERTRSLSSTAEVSPVTRGAKRPPPRSRKETEELLWRLANGR